MVPVTRHTRIVALSKHFLVLLVAAVIALVVWIGSDNSGENKARMVFSNIAKSANLQNIMMKPHYQGVDARNRPFTVIADTATQVDKDNVEIHASAEPTRSDEEPEPTDDSEQELPRVTSQDDPLSDGMKDMDEKINVERILDCVSNPSKRMAFHLYMDGVPYKTKKKNVESIAQALDISEKTARDWVKEVRQLLAEHEGVKHLKKLRVGVRS